MNSLFGADGIRGVIATPPLTDESLHQVGRSVAAWLNESERTPVLLIGTDTRLSSQRLAGILIESLNQAGVTTVNSGILPTAALSYLVAKKGFFSGGIVVTASHNPINENGIKIFDQHGIKISDDAENRIEDYFQQRENLPLLVARAHNRIEEGYLQQYVDALTREFSQFYWKDFRILIDCANGAASSTAPSAMEKLGLGFTLLNAWPDGTNINHLAGSEYIRLGPERMLVNLERYNHSIGIALDGDADRVVLVDKEGRFYDGDTLLALLAIRFQKANRLGPDKIITTNASNSGLAEYLNRFGIQVITVRNGDKYITEALLRQNITLGGEQIGHLIIHTNSNWVTGDGLRTALVVLSELAANPGMRLADLAPGMRKYPQIKVSVCLDQRTSKSKEEIPGLTDKIAEIQERFPDVTVRDCRPASTEATYRLMLESRLTSVLTLANLAYELAILICNHLDSDGSNVYMFDCANGGKISLNQAYR